MLSAICQPHGIPDRLKSLETWKKFRKNMSERCGPRSRPETAAPRLLGCHYAKTTRRDPPTPSLDPKLYETQILMLYSTNKYIKGLIDAHINRRNTGVTVWVTNEERRAWTARDIFSTRYHGAATLVNFKGKSHWEEETIIKTTRSLSNATVQCNPHMMAHFW